MSDIESANFSETAANNNATPPNGGPEGMAPSQVNDWGREVMAGTKREWNRSHPTVTSGGSANTQTLTYGAAPASYVQGHTFSFIAGFTNTGSATLNVNAIAAKNVFMDGVALAGGEIVAGSVVQVMYDGTQFQITSSRAISTLPGGFKNLLINGDMEVFQRGGGANVSVAATTIAYTIDRWVLTTGATQASTVSQQTGLSNQSQNCARVQRTAGQTGIAAIQFQCPLTTDILALLRGKIVTLSAKVRSGALFSPTSGLVNMSFIVGVGAEGKRGAGFSTETTPCSTSVNLGTSSAITPISCTSTAIVPTTTTQGCVIFTWTPVGTAGATDYVEIDDVQLEIGGVATAFDRRPFVDELARCQRFYQKSFGYGTVPAQGTNNNALMVNISTGASGLFGVSFPLFPQMRVAPSATTYNPVSANANWRDISNGVDKTVTVVNAGLSNLTLTGAAGVANSQCTIGYSLDADL